MSAIAQVLAGRGVRVLGSDRNHDRGLHSEMFGNLKAQGIELVAQDGRSVDKGVDELIVSSAVEASIPDIGAAQRLGIPIRKRAELLADLFNDAQGIAVGGTSGKSTVTGMIGTVLHGAGLAPTIVSGGKMLNFDQKPYLGNAIEGSGPLVIEADESDGTIAFYEPEISVLTNISLDHMPLDELRPLFRAYCERARQTCVVNADCEESVQATEGLERRTFAIDHVADVRASDVEPDGSGVSFSIDATPVRIPVLGYHNVSNALATIAVCQLMGVSVGKSAAILEDFKGIARRLEVLGSAGGVTVIDDFAHNPDKVVATLRALKVHDSPLHVVFQPHGFGPTRMLREGLVDAFTSHLDESDRLWMPEIYYAGGTAEKTISSGDLVADVDRGGKRAAFVADRESLGEQVAEAVKEGDRIVVMGARDDSLTDFGHSLLARIEANS